MMGTCDQQLDAARGPHLEIRCRSPGDERHSINTVAEPFIRLRAIHHLEKHYIVIFAAGIGNPYVTTDYTAAQRAIETRSQALLFAKNQVSGIFTSDPLTDPQARRYQRMHYNTIIQEDLTIVDQSSVLLARDHQMPMHFFDFSDNRAYLPRPRHRHLGDGCG